MSWKTAVRYRGRRLPSGAIIERKDESLPGRGKWSKLSPLKSLRAMNHSPTGFAWGYGGSGPAQTALALLLDYTGNKELSLRLHQPFKWAFVGGWGDQWEITGDQIAEFIKTKGQAQ